TGRLELAVVGRRDRLWRPALGHLLRVLRERGRRRKRNQRERENCGCGEAKVRFMGAWLPLEPQGHGRVGGRSRGVAEPAVASGFPVRVTGPDQDAVAAAVEQPRVSEATAARHAGTPRGAPCLRPSLTNKCTPELPCAACASTP